MVGGRSSKVRVEVLNRMTSMVPTQPTSPCETINSSPSIFGTISFIDFAQFPAVETLDQLPNLLGQSLCHIDPTMPHQAVPTTEKEFELWGNKGWVSGGNCDGAEGVELLQPS